MRALLLIALMQIGAASNSTGGISGIVESSATTRSIQGVTISVYKANAPVDPLLVTTTDSNGRFSFPSISAGAYFVTFHKDGYAVPQLKPSKIQINVAPNQAVNDIVVALDVLGLVTGRIVDGEARPLSRVQVEAWKVPEGSRKEFESSGISAETDDRGEYSLFWLPRGKYVICGKIKIGNSAPGFSSGDQFEKVYAPGTPDIRSAMVVEVTSDDARITGIDLSFRLSPTFSISGTIVTQKMVSVSLVREESVASSGEYLRITPTQKSTDGGMRLEFRSVLPGVYHLFVSTISAPGRQWANQIVDVNDRMLTILRYPSETALT